MGKTIGIISFKGGVGKTTSAVNIASSLAKLDKNVVVVDSNFSSPNLHVHLGLLKPTVTLADVLKQKKDVHEAVYAHHSGIDIVPNSFQSQDLDLRKYKEKINVLKEGYDYVILDSSPTINEELIAVLMAADELIFITTPDYSTLLSTMRAAEISKQNNLKISGIIINKKRNKSYELKKNEIEKTVNLNVIGELDDDSKVIEASSKFTPLIDYSPKNKNAKEYIKIAGYIAGEKLKKKNLSHYITKTKDWLKKSGYFGKISFSDVVKDTRKK
ncbi:MAG: AAA family ATPase [Candidatus Nanoarchaeia archaeon]